MGDQLPKQMLQNDKEQFSLRDDDSYENIKIELVDDQYGSQPYG